jgi:hypothetical protein
MAQRLRHGGRLLAHHPLDAEHGKERNDLQGLPCLQRERRLVACLEKPAEPILDFARPARWLKPRVPDQHRDVKHEPREAVAGVEHP